MGKIILIVEDDRMLRDLMAMDLQDQGASVHIATDGDEALEILKRVQPDLILLDLLMPKKDGYAILQSMRTSGSAVPTVILSNLSAPEEVEKCKKLGAADFLVKSELASGELWSRIKGHLGL